MQGNAKTINEIINDIFNIGIPETESSISVSVASIVPENGQITRAQATYELLNNVEENNAIRITLI